MIGRLGVVVGLAACGGGEEPRDRGPTPIVLEASCELQAGNALRVDCTATVEPAAALTVEIAPSGLPSRSLELPAAADHAFTLSGLPAETSVVWTVRAGRGEVTGVAVTGTLPTELPSLAATGTATAPYVLFAVGTWLVVSDRDGRIVWYQGTEPDGVEPMRGLVSGYDWTGDGVAWHITSTLHHVGVDGRERLSLSRGVDFDRPLHHDLFWRAGRLWSLNADVHTTPNGDFVYDGLYAFDEAGVLAEWDLYDVFDDVPVWSGSPQVMWDGLFPDAEDVAHGNAVFEAEDGTVLVSFRKLSAVYALRGIEDPAWGTVAWILRGKTASDFAITADPALTADADFQGQHHARLVGDRLTLFDNRSGTDARTVAIALDHAADEARIVEVHALDRECGIQGSAYELSNGNTLATCATSIELFEFAAGGAADARPVWTLTVDADAPWLARGIPIESPPPGW